MAGKIVIDINHCKGCGLCMLACPKGCIGVGDQANAKGYFPVEFKGNGADSCGGCAICAIVCPDTAITVYRDAGGDTPADPTTDRKKIEGRK
jgi:2-oxoglutarate ferredoxin oxidoreductase subunit delta